MAIFWLSFLYVVLFSFFSYVLTWNISEQYFICNLMKESLRTSTSISISKDNFHPVKKNISRITSVYLLNLLSKNIVWFKCNSLHKTEFQVHHDQRFKFLRIPLVFKYCLFKFSNSYKNFFLKSSGFQYLRTQKYYLFVWINNNKD